MFLLKGAEDWRRQFFLTTNFRENFHTFSKYRNASQFLLIIQKFTRAERNWERDREKSRLQTNHWKCMRGFHFSKIKSLAKFSTNPRERETKLSDQSITMTQRQLTQFDQVIQIYRKILKIYRYIHIFEHIYNPFYIYPLNIFYIYIGVYSLYMYGNIIYYCVGLYFSTNMKREPASNNFEYWSAKQKKIVFSNLKELQEFLILLLLFFL